MTVDELRRFLAELPDDMQVLFYDAEADTFDTPHLTVLPIVTDDSGDGPLHEVEDGGEPTLVILQEPLDDEEEAEDEDHVDEEDED